VQEMLRPLRKEPELFYDLEHIFDDEMQPSQYDRIHVSGVSTGPLYGRGAWTEGGREGVSE